MENISITSFEQIPQGITLLLQRIDMLISLQSRPDAQPSAPPPADEYLTRKEAKDLLGVSYPTLTAWTNEGKIKGYRIGTRVRYKASEIGSALTPIKSTSAAA